MGAKHPEAVLAQLNANKNEFILAARHLIKKGVVNSPGDAIRYMEEHNTNIKELIEQITVSKQTKILKQETEDDTSDQPQSTE